jgi:hypothetical protein
MDYLQSKKISNSSLSYINPEQGGSPRKFKDYLDGNLEHLETPSLYAGSTIHKFILEPDTFAISDVERPSDTIVKIIDKVYEITRAEMDTDLNSNKEYIFGSAKEFNYGQSWKPDTLIKKIIEQGNDYYNFLLRADGKTCIDAKMASVLTAVSDSLKNNKKASELLFGEGENEKELYWGPNCTYKSKIDRVAKCDCGDHEYHLVDLKTTSKSVEFFRSSFDYYHYDRQMAFYYDALVDQNIGPLGEVYIIAVETTGYYQTRVFEISPELLIEGRKKYKDLLDRIAWHKDRGDWSDRREILEGNKVTILNNDN